MICQNSAGNNFSYLKGHVSFQTFILKGHIYSNTGWSLILVYVFTQISSVTLITFFTPQMWRLFDGGVYLKVGHDKELLSP